MRKWPRADCSQTNSQPAQGGRRHERSNHRRLDRLVMMADRTLPKNPKWPRGRTSRFNEQFALVHEVHVLLEAKADPNKNVILAGYMSIHTITIQ